MSLDSLTNSKKTLVVDGEADSDAAMRGIQTFSAVVGTFLLIGFFANGVIIWKTSRLHFLARREIFRLSLRCSSAIDVSLCTVLAVVMLIPWETLYTGSDVTTLQCTRLGLAKIVYGVGFIAAGGIAVVCRHVAMLCTFEHQADMFDQHRARFIRFLKDVLIVGIVCLVVSTLLIVFAPTVDILLCFVDGSLRPRIVYILMVPAVVSIVLGVSMVGCTSISPEDCERPQSLQVTKGDLFDKSTLVDQQPEVGEMFDRTTLSRWHRLVIVSNVAVVTWCMLLFAVTMIGLLLQPVDVGTMFALAGCAALDSAWCAFAILRYWT